MLSTVIHRLLIKNRPTLKLKKGAVFEPTSNRPSTQANEMVG